MKKSRSLLHNLFEQELDLDWAYWWVGIFIFLLAISGASAQTVATTGTIVDHDGQTWFSAHVRLTWAPNPNYPNAAYNINGTSIFTDPIYKNYIDQTVNSDGSGFFHLTTLDTSKISPSGSTYTLIIQSYTSAPSSTFPQLATQSSFPDISAFIAANITNPRFSAVAGQYGGAFGYSTGEVTAVPVPGGSFFNITTLLINVWNGTAWQTQAIGSFCSTTTCNITIGLTSPNINNVCEASLQGVSGWIAGINACANQGYMSGGGIVTAYGYGNTVQTDSTLMTGLYKAGRPIRVILNPATQFIATHQFSTAQLNAFVATGISSQDDGAGGVTGPCLIPIGQGSSIDAATYNGFGNGQIRLNATSQTADLICNAYQDGTQESFMLRGVTARGDIGAILKGSLIHLRTIFTNTELDNVATYLPYGNGLFIEGSSDINCKNCVLADGAQSGNYLGTVLTIVNSSNITFTSGAIQNNGVHNTLMKLFGFSAVAGIAGNNIFNIHFYNTDFEITAATIGSIAGHDTDVNPIQMTDASNILIDQLIMAGNKGADQTHMVEIFVSGTNGQSLGPIEIDNIMGGNTVWGGLSLIHNTVNTIYNGSVNGRLQDLVGHQQGSQVAIGKYRWLGGTTATQQETDYIDNEDVENLVTHSFQNIAYAYSNLPTCNSTTEGKLQGITDSSTLVYGATITGGGFNHVQAYCDSHNWLVAGSSSTSQFQMYRVTSGFCTTSGLAGASGACTIGPFSWAKAFLDNNYGINCQVIGSQTNASNLGVSPNSGNNISAFASNAGASGFYVTLWTTTTTATTLSSGAEVNCIGVHN